MDIEKEVEVIQSYPVLFYEEENENTGSSISMEELESTLKAMARDKSLGLDGWLVEIFLHFVDIMGPDLLLLVEELRTNCFIYSVLNSKFIMLIANVSVPNSCKDYRPIALCNTLYKMISKIIANWLKVTLSKHIALEQFMFLKNHQI